MRRIIPVFTFLLFFAVWSINAQDDIYYEDFIYVEQIKSVKLAPVNDPTAIPVTQLHNSKPLLLQFDDLDARDKRYTYSITHFDRNWEPSEIEEMEYLEGFNGEEISDSYHSLHTKIKYVHYSLQIPNSYVRFIISGNYLLTVYDEDQYPIITRRFLVVDPQVSLNAQFSRPKKVSRIKSHQNLDISIDHSDYYIRDAINEVSVTVLQNFRWLDAIENVKPKNALGNELTFDVFDPFIFPGLKEFRSFDVRSLLYTSRYVYAINANAYDIDVILEKDKKRTYMNFISEYDLNGNFILGNSDDRYGVQSAEYVNVAYTLESPLEIDKHDVYVIGGFSDWQLYEENRLEYDSELFAYVGDVVHKQGYYNYYYALVNNNDEIDLNTLEGSWYETDNTYQVLVYYREFGSYYDKLIGMYSVKY